MKILSFGEIIWDIFGEKKHIGGAPLNFAAHCAILGSKAWLASAVGDDEPGNGLKCFIKQIILMKQNTNL